MPKKVSMIIGVLGINPGVTDDGESDQRFERRSYKRGG